MTRTVCILYWLLTLSSLASGQTRNPENRCIAESGASLRARLPALIDSAGIPGLALALIDRGAIVWMAGFGSADSAGQRVSPSRTVFEAASLSKPVIAYAAIRLVDAGSLDLDRPLVEYAPNPDFHGDPRGRLVTARMVLAHTTGLQNERMGRDSLRFSFAPGERFQYSGEGYVYLGRVIEIITRQSLANAVKALVFDPLEMKRSSFIWESRFSDGAAIGHGRFGEPRRPTRPAVARAPSSLQTTVADYARFLLAIQLGEGLRPGTLRTMITPAVQVAPGVGWGLGWAIETGSAGPGLAHHGDNSNSGFTAFALLDVARRCGLVYFANSANGLSVVREIAHAISGTHPGVELLPYERYDTPVALARARMRRALQTGGIDAVFDEFRAIRTQSPQAAPEGLLNDLGYSLLNRSRAGDAVQVFQENVRAYPRSGNVYDSLGEALLAAGNPIQARDAYRRAAELDSNNSRARFLADSLGVAIRR